MLSLYPTQELETAMIAGDTPSTRQRKDVMQHHIGLGTRVTVVSFIPSRFVCLFLCSFLFMSHVCVLF